MRPLAAAKTHLVEEGTARVSGAGRSPRHFGGTCQNMFSGNCDSAILRVNLRPEPPLWRRGCRQPFFWNTSPKHDEPVTSHGGRKTSWGHRVEAMGGSVTIGLRGVAKSKVSPDHCCDCGQSGLSEIYRVLRPRPKTQEGTRNPPEGWQDGSNYLGCWGISEFQLFTRNKVDGVA